MKLSRILPALALTIMAGHAHAGPTWHTSTIKWIYPQSNGNFILIFDQNAASCGS